MLINCPVMMPAANFSISNEQFMKDCTSRIGTMMNFISPIILPAAAPKLQQPKKRRVVNDYDDDDEDEKMTSTFASGPSASFSTALLSAFSTIEIQDDVRELPHDYKNLLDELGFKLYTSFDRSFSLFYHFAKTVSILNREYN